jgi:hypothetical protein
MARCTMCEHACDTERVLTLAGHPCSSTVLRVPWPRLFLFVSSVAAK